MASTNKTSLGFNQWIGTDKPKWADFNADNALLDAELKKRAEIDVDGRVKQDAKNSQALGGKSYSQLFDSAGAAKNALSFGGHTYTQLFDETGAVQNAINFNGQAFNKLFNSENKAVLAADSDRLGGKSASEYAVVSMYDLALINGFKNIKGKGTIRACKMGKLVAISGAVMNTAASDNDRAIFVIPEEIRPSYTVNYEHFKSIGNAWIREWSGEFMAQNTIKDMEIYVFYLLD